jgi:hypothetical protein
MSISLILEKVMGGLKDEKIGLSALATIVFFAYYAWVWADDAHTEFARKTDIQKIEQTITNHTEEFRIVSAGQLARDIKLSLQLSQATGASDAELRIMEAKLLAAEKYKDCLINRRPNCEHLKPSE